MTFLQWQSLSGLKTQLSQVQFNLFRNSHSQREPHTNVEQPSPALAVEQNDLPTDSNDEVMVGDEEELQDTQQNITTT